MCYNEEKGGARVIDFYVNSRGNRLPRRFNLGNIMTEKERLIAEEEERFAEECRKHNERIAEIQGKSGWRPGSYPSIVVYSPGGGFRIVKDFRFKTQEKAEEIREKEQLWEDMQQWADENNGEFLNFYCILWVSPENKIHVKTHRLKRDIMGVYFSSSDLAEQAREKFGDEILRVWGK